jgi:hypothetical protein
MAVEAGILGLVASGWLVRYLLTGYGPDYQTVIWLMIAAAILQPLIEWICFEARPANHHLVASRQASTLS